MNPLDTQKPHHRPRYSPEVEEALLPLWEASDRFWGKRLEGLLLLVNRWRHDHLVLLENGNPPALQLV